MFLFVLFVFFFSSRRRHTRSLCDWSSDVCSSDLCRQNSSALCCGWSSRKNPAVGRKNLRRDFALYRSDKSEFAARSEEHTSELQSHSDLVCRLLLEKKKKKIKQKRDGRNIVKKVR